MRAYWQDAEKIDLSERLKEIQCPVLFIRGEMQGSLLPAEKAEALAKSMRSARIESLPNTAHEVGEKDHDLFISILSSFMREVEQ